MDLMKSPKMLSYYVCTMSHKSHKWLNYDKTSANFRNRMKWMYGLCNLTSTPFDKIDCEETYSYWNWKIKSNMNTCNLTSRIWHIGLWIKRSQNPWLCFLFFFLSIPSQCKNSCKQPRNVFKTQRINYSWSRW